MQISTPVVRKHSAVLHSAALVSPSRPVQYQYEEMSSVNLNLKDAAYIRFATANGQYFWTHNLTCNTLLIYNGATAVDGAVASLQYTQ